MDIGLILFLNPAMGQRILKENAARWTRFVERSTPLHWSENMPAPGSDIVLSAKTWEPFTLFDEDTESPCGTWRYNHNPIQAAVPLDVKTHRGHHQVVFDKATFVPRVMEHKPNRSPTLWMSYTPQEVLTQRPGLRRSKGHTIIAGLGMGWLLVRTLQRKKVKRVTLVEISQPLVDWLLPALKEKHDAPWEKLEVKIGDARKIIPTLSADIALWDIWEQLGTANNEYDLPRIEKQCPDVKEHWLWGAANWR